MLSIAVLVLSYIPRLLAGSRNATTELRPGCISDVNLRRQVFLTGSVSILGLVNPGQTRLNQGKIRLNLGEFRFNLGKFRFNLGESLYHCVVHGFEGFFHTLDAVGQVYDVGCGSLQ